MTWFPSGSATCIPCNRVRKRIHKGPVIHQCGSPLSPYFNTHTPLRQSRSFPKTHTSRGQACRRDGIKCEKSVCLRLRFLYESEAANGQMRSLAGVQAARYRDCACKACGPCPRTLCKQSRPPRRSGAITHRHKEEVLLEADKRRGAHRAPFNPPRDARLPGGSRWALTPDSRCAHASA